MNYRKMNINVKKPLLGIVILLLIRACPSFAQTDPHFTQNYTYPMYVNPALAGSSDGEYRVSAIFRTQWGSVSNPYRTVGLSFDARTNKNISIGVSILNQSAGDAGYNYLTSSVSIAYSGIKLGKELNHRIVLAIQPGVLNRRVDPSKFKWGDQWNPITGYNSSNLTSESFARTSATTFDVGAGALYYDATPDKKSNFFGGFSVLHLNKPKDPIISQQSTVLNTIPMRYVVHAGISYNISPRTSVIPHALYMRQGTASETMVGLYAQLNVNEETDFMIGGYYRLKDAVAPFVGLDWKNFIIGVSYDANTSRLGAMSRSVNSVELSLTYIKRKADRSIIDFIRCARL
jgi:type IX secretion system PorP/SprF family membrane protein